MKIALWAALVCAVVSSATADERALRLKAAPGMETVENNCSSCHSVDYILTNSPFLTRAGWRAEVEKMSKDYGAPISEDDAERIVDYLADNY